MSARISSLPIVVSANILDTDILPIVTGIAANLGVTKRVSVSELRLKLGTTAPAGGRTVTSASTYLTNNAVFNVKDYGAFGDGTTDDATAISLAIAQLGSGGVLYFPAGRYLISSATTPLPADNIRIQGASGAVIVRHTALAKCLSAVSKNYLSIDGLRFETASNTTGFTQANTFIEFTSCNYVSVRHTTFYSLNGTGEPTMFSQLHLQYCNDCHVQDNYFIGSYGNSTGADSNAGVGGQRHIYLNNHVLDFVDTGIGLWTGAADCIVAGNQIRAFPITPGATLVNAANYARVGIDCAGASRNRIADNTITRCTIGIRHASNMTYNNTDNEISNNNIGEQESSHDGAGTMIEPAQCIKIFESNGAEASLRVLGNQLRPVAGGWAVTAYAAGGAASVVRLEIDSNLFIATAATASGVTLQGLAGNGTIKLVPGQNTWKFSGGATPFGSMGGAAAGITILERTRHSIVDYRTPWNAAVNFNNAATLNTVYSRTLDVGFYATDIGFGVMTDVGAQSVATILGVTGIVIGNPFQNTTRTYLGAFNAVAAGGFTYTSAAAGNNYTFPNFILQRVI